MFYCLLKGVFKNSAKIMIKANHKKGTFTSPSTAIFRKIFFFFKLPLLQFEIF